MATIISLPKAVPDIINSSTGPSGMASGEEGLLLVDDPHRLKKLPVGLRFLSSVPDGVKDALRRLRVEGCLEIAGVAKGVSAGVSRPSKPEGKTVL